MLRVGILQLQMCTTYCTLNYCIQVLVELLHNYGLIDKYIYRERHCVPILNLKSRQVRIYSDCLSMEKKRHMQNRVYSVVTHPGKVDFFSNILDALNQYQQGVGDLHIGMHMMVLLYKVCYLGMIQVLQAVLAWALIREM